MTRFQSVLLTLLALLVAWTVGQAAWTHALPLALAAAGALAGAVHPCVAWTAFGLVVWIPFAWLGRRAVCHAARGRP